MVVAAAGTSQINLIWTNVPAADTYAIYRGTKSAAEGGKKKLLAKDLTDISYSDGGLDSDKTYFYTVDVIDSDGETLSTSNEAFDTTDSSD